MSQYDDQAWDFLRRYSIGFSAKFARNQKCPPWDDPGCVHGDRYRIALRKPGHRSIVFDFWNSQNDSQNGKTPTPYDVLACISGDTSEFVGFQEFCDNYGLDQDSRRAYDLYRRVDKFSKRLRAFFTPEEIDSLNKIR